MEFCIARVCRFFGVAFAVVFNAQATPDPPTATLVICPDGEAYIVQIPPEARDYDIWATTDSQGSWQVLWKNFGLEDIEQHSPPEAPDGDVWVTTDSQDNRQAFEEAPRLEDIEQHSPPEAPDGDVWGTIDSQDNEQAFEEDLGLSRTSTAGTPLDRSLDEQDIEQPYAVEPISSFPSDASYLSWYYLLPWSALLAFTIGAYYAESISSDIVIFTTLLTIGSGVYILTKLRCRCD